MVKVYLDTCSIQRPLDTLNQTRLKLEAEAVLGILAQVDIGQIELISSTALELEISRTPFSVRRQHGKQILEQASSIIVIDGLIERRAEDFVQLGINAMDALHLAAAEASGADYFCTCDYQFLRKAKRIPDLLTVVVSPLELIEVIE